MSKIPFLHFFIYPILFTACTLFCATFFYKNLKTNNSQDVDKAPLLSAERGQYGLTPLQQAIVESDIAKAKYCLENGADIELRILSAYIYADKRISTHFAADNIEGHTPLHLAVLVGDPEMVQLLLSFSPDLESRITPFGYTPLLYAIALGDEKILSILIHAGADRHATTDGWECWENADRGYSAQDIALKKNHESCIPILKSSN